jgi:hypothetical protein
LNVASTTLALTIKPRKRYLSDSWEIKVCRENKTDGGGKNYVGMRSKIDDNLKVKKQ